MIYAKTNNNHNKLELFPLTEEEVRNLNSTSSLPEYFTNKNLPRLFVPIFDKENQELNEKYKFILENIPDITIVKNTLTGHWTLDVTEEELTNLINFNEFNEELEHAKYLKLIELQEYIENYIKLNTDTELVSAFEMQTWSQQFEEAILWESNNSINTPLLDKLALLRQIEPSILKTKVLQKGRKYNDVLIFAIGKKQYIKDLINACSTIKDIENISFDTIIL